MLRDPVHGVRRHPPPAYVANSGSGNLSVIDTRTRRVARQLPAGRHPVGVALTPGGESAYVADEW
jgi:YVTN family beta-propeller protein